MSTNPPHLSTPVVLTPFAFCYNGQDVAMSLICQSWRRLPLAEMPTVVSAWAPCESRDWSMRDAAHDDLQAIAACHEGTVTALEVSGPFLTLTVAVRPPACLHLLSALDQRLHSLGVAFVDVQIDGR